MAQQQPNQRHSDGDRDAALRSDAGFHGGHGVDVREQQLHAERCPGGRRQLSCDYGEGKRDGRRHLAAGEPGDRIGGRSAGASITDSTVINPAVACTYALGAPGRPREPARKTIR